MKKIIKLAMLFASIAAGNMQAIHRAHRVHNNVVHTKTILGHDGHGERHILGHDGAGRRIMPGSNPATWTPKHLPQPESNVKVEGLLGHDRAGERKLMGNSSSTWAPISLGGSNLYFVGSEETANLGKAMYNGTAFVGVVVTNAPRNGVGPASTWGANAVYSKEQLAYLEHNRINPKEYTVIVNFDNALALAKYELKNAHHELKNMHINRLDTLMTRRESELEGQIRDLTTHIQDLQRYKGKILIGIEMGQPMDGRHATPVVPAISIFKK